MNQLLSAWLLVLLNYLYCIEGNVFGDFLGCKTLDDSSCLWIGADGRQIGTKELVHQILQGTDTIGDAQITNLHDHINYIKKLHRYAGDMNHTLGMTSRISRRHLFQFPYDLNNFKEHVHADIKSRSLSLKSSLRRLDGGDLPVSMNWCETNNPANMSVCTPIKQQQHCGSCWAFAATDAIEAAVAIVAKKSPVELSPQQLLDCSHDSMSNTFSYCWVSGSANGASWLQRDKTWESTNQGCNGGMTHLAFNYVAANPNGLVSNLVYPYTEGNGNSTVRTCKNSNQTSARIRSWKQAVGPHCESGRDVNYMLKKALQEQPIAVAINSGGGFSTYGSGIYSCPNAGQFASPDQINHALVLVGYGTGESGNYWILKNSYGAQWGIKGYMYLKEDSEINCGLNVYPVVPTGASDGGAIISVDSGGVNDFVGLSFSIWIGVGVAVSIATVVLIVLGIVVVRNRSMY